MSEVSPKSSGWAEANRLLGALAASLGGEVEARLGSVEAQPADPDDWSERAAIMEYDGGLPREAAEAFARELATLGPQPSPKALAALDARLQAMDARRASSRPKQGARR